MAIGPRFGLGLAVLIAACGPRSVARAPELTPGVSIAIYGGATPMAVVDDRRWAEVTGGVLLLDQIDPAAALASLVIELAGGARVGACARDRVPLDGHGHAALVRCATDAAPGRYLVRVIYATDALVYRARHDVAITDPARATVTTRFAIATPRRAAHAEVILHEGAPGDPRAPRELARGRVALDGTTAVLVAPARELAARLRRVYTHDVDTEPAELVDDATAPRPVWVVLELADARLAPGAAFVHVALPGEAAREIETAVPGGHPTDERPAARPPLRLPLWIDPSLRALRQSYLELDTEAVRVERNLYSIANLGDAPREVALEIRLREARRRQLVRAWPARPSVSGDTLRATLDVPPARIARAAYTVAYDPR